MTGAWEWILHFSGMLEDGILSLTESVWIYPAIFAVSVIDAFFPVVPSESIVIAAATASAAAGRPFLAGVWLAAALGAWCGDQTGRFIGSRINVREWAFFRRPKVHKTLVWAERGIERRGTSLIIAARFIPMGRVAVNLTAGALGYPPRRYMGVTAIAAAIWATWGVVLGTVAGSAFEGNLLLAVVVGVVGGIILGQAVDLLLSRLGVSQPQLPDLDARHDADAGHDA